MRLLYDNKIKDAILTPSSENANYPASNLKDSRLSRHLRFTGDVWETLLIDSGGLLKDIFQATVNRLENSNNLTLWPTAGATVVASGLYYDGSEFAKVTNSGAATGCIYQAETGVFTTLTPSGNVICRKGNTVGNTARIGAENLTVPGYILYLVIDFDNYPNSPGTSGTGILRWYRWIDSQTVELHFTCASLAAMTDDVQMFIYASPNATADEYTYWMRPQLEDLPYDTPYVDGSRAAVSPNHAFQMPEMFIFKFKVRPWFAYDTETDHRIVGWYVDDNHRFILFYANGPDKFVCWWKDDAAGTACTLDTEAFSDSAPNDINSDLIFFAAINLKKQTGQRFFVIVDGAKQAEDNAFSGTPDPKISTFPTLLMGHQQESNHATSQFESAQFWAWDGVNNFGTLASEAEIDAAMAGKPTIFEQIYQPKIKASYAALAGHNISADALIHFQGNDWNSWNGPPFWQLLTWDQAIILENFAEKEYAFWRFVINNPNNVDGYVKLGLAYLGTYLQLPYIEPGVEMPRRTASVKTKSGSGQVYGRKNYRYHSFTVVYPPFIDSDERDAIDQMFAQVLNVDPLFVLLWENSLDMFSPLYCTIVEPELPWRKLEEGRCWGLSISFEEVF